MVNGDFIIKNRMELGSSVENSRRQGSTVSVISGSTKFEAPIIFQDGILEVPHRVEVVSGSPIFNGDVTFGSISSTPINLIQNDNPITFNGQVSIKTPIAFNGNVLGTGTITVTQATVMIATSMTMSTDVIVKDDGLLHVPDGVNFGIKGKASFSLSSSLYCQGSCSLSDGVIHGTISGSGSLIFLGKHLIFGRIENIGPISIVSGGHLTMSTASRFISNSIITSGSGVFISNISATYFAPLSFSGNGVSHIALDTSPIFNNLVTVDGAVLDNDGGVIVTFVIGLTITPNGGEYRHRSGALAGGKISINGGLLSLILSSREDISNVISIQGSGNFLLKASGLTFLEQVSIGGSGNSSVLEGSATFKTLIISTPVTVIRSLNVHMCSVLNSGSVSGRGTISVVSGGSLIVRTNTTISTRIIVNGYGHISIAHSPFFSNSIDIHGFGKSEILQGSSPTFLDTVTIDSGSFLYNSGFQMTLLKPMLVDGSFIQESGRIIGGGNIIINGQMKINGAHNTIQNPINMTQNVLLCNDQTNIFTSLITNINICATRGNCLPESTCLNCTNGFTNCQNSCFGVDASRRTVCSGHGKCIANDKCECSDGYTGNQCQYPICFGISSSLNTSCSGNGKCINPDQCVCDCGWVGNSCSHAICFNLIANETNICSGHGDCTIPNVCICKPGWNGPKCENFNCFGLEKTSPEVCGKNGVCVGANECQCGGNYFGMYCSDWACNNINSTQGNVSSLICGGRGECIAPEVCNCHFLMMGNNCDIYLNWILVSYACIVSMFLLSFGFLMLFDVYISSAHFCAYASLWNPVVNKQLSFAPSKGKRGVSTMKNNTGQHEEIQELMDLKRPLIQSEE